MRALRVRLDMPLQRLDQGLRRCRGANNLRHLWRLDLHHRPCRNVPSGSLYAPEQIPRGFGSDEELFGETDSTGAFESLQQFHAPETVETKVPFERTIQGNRQRTAFMRMELNGKLPNRSKYSIY